MAFPLPADAYTALENSRRGCRYVVQATYGERATIPNPEALPGDPFYKWDSVPVTTDGQICFDLAAGVQASGQVFVARDTGGVSLVPHSPTDPLAPFGQELTIHYLLDAGGRSWSIPLGVYQILAAPTMREYYRRNPHARSLRLTGFEVALELADEFDRIIGDDFLAAVNGPTRPTVLEEVALLAADAQVSADWPAGLDDGPVPSGTVYESTRLDAIAMLLASLDCDPGMTKTGNLTAIRRGRWQGATREDADLTMSGVIDMDDSLTREGIVNQISTVNPDLPIPAGVARITDGWHPLRVNGPLGPRTARASNPLMNTAAKLTAASATSLKRRSVMPARDVTVTGLPRPDADLGDLVYAVDDTRGRAVLGQLTGFTAEMDPTASWTYTLEAPAAFEVLP